MDSPVAKALMKKHQGDDVLIKTPGGENNYYINKVQYKPLNI